ncbi:MAG: hypothetical protein ACYCUF_04250 [Acidimicrobiales bacterium]
MGAAPGSPRTEPGSPLSDPWLLAEALGWPAAGSQSGEPLGFVDLGRITGAYSMVERRLFEILGGWSAVEEAPAVRVFFDVQSRQHAWHAELWNDLSASGGPQTGDPVAGNALAEPAMRLLSRIEDDLRDPASEGEVQTSLRLSALGRVVFPRLVVGYRRHLRHTSFPADTATVRVLRLVTAGEQSAWQAAEALLQAACASLGDASAGTESTRRWEALIRASGPGLVTFPGARSERAT